MSFISLAKARHSSSIKRLKKPAAHVIAQREQGIILMRVFCLCHGAEKTLAGASAECWTAF
jgi:hypothetical protein